MAELNVPWVAFNGGEIGPESLARVDLDVYPTTAETMENVFPAMQGSMSKAPGTEYIGRTYLDSTAIVRSFVFNVDQIRILEITEGRITLVDGNAYVGIDGAAATIGAPVNNASSGGSSVAVSGLDVTFTAVSGGEARADWPITAGVNGTPVTFRFEIERRPLKISVGTSAILQDIPLPGSVYELTLYPGVHLLTFTPTATSYYIRARLPDEGKALLKNLTRLSTSDFYIPTPYLADDLPGLRVEQSADTFWLYHPEFETRVLERRANTSWSLRLFRPLNGPFESPNTSINTLTPSARTGSITVTAIQALFTPQSVGQLLEITHQGQTETKTFSAVDQKTDPIRVTGVSTSRVFHLTITGVFTATVKLQRSAGNDVDWVDYTSYTATTSIDIDDALDNQIIYYRVICSAYTSGSPAILLSYSGGQTIGHALIVAYSTPLLVTAEVFDDAFGAITASSVWSVGAWSDALGWPAAGQLYDGRHHLVRDDRYWASESDDYESFLIGTNDSDAIARRMGTGDVNIARWIESAIRLLIGTGGAELEVRTTAFDEAITPTNINVRGVDDWGSADSQAARAGKRTLYIDRTRALLLQALFDANTNTHEVDNLCRLHETIAGDIEPDSGAGFVEIAYQKRPEPRVWCVRSDGELAVLLFGPKEGVYAWARYTAPSGGLYKRVCVAPGSPEDWVHCIVQRTIQGEARMFHERFQLQRFVESEDAWRLQCALKYEGAATDQFTGLDHLDGEFVSIWADGRVHPERYVANGTLCAGDALLLENGGHLLLENGGYLLLETASDPLPMDFECTTAIIGLNYVGLWKSSKLAYGAQMGTALAQDKTVGKLGLVLHRTPVGAVKYWRAHETDDAGRYLGDIVKPEFAEGFIMDGAVPLISTEFNQPFEGETAIDSRVCLIFDTPMPATILALVPNMELSES